MKQNRKSKKNKTAERKYSAPTCFEVMMNMQCDMRAELRLAPLEHWQKTRETPEWSKNIFRNFKKTIFKSLQKLRPRGTVNWFNFGCMVGIGERYITFMMHDLPRIFKEDGFDKISAKRWKRIKARLGLDQMRAHYLKSLGLPADDKTSDEDLIDLALEKQFANIEKMKQTAFAFVAEINPKKKALFLKGMEHGFRMFLNVAGEFSGDDRRTDIHMELLAWQHDIEKLQRSVVPKNNKHLIGELKKLPEFKNRTHDWFTEVFKDIKLAVGKRGRPPKYSQA